MIKLAADSGAAVSGASAVAAAFRASSWASRSASSGSAPRRRTVSSACAIHKRSLSARRMAFARDVHQARYFFSWTEVGLPRCLANALSSLRSSASCGKLEGLLAGGQILLDQSRGRSCRRGGTRGSRSSARPPRLRHRWRSRAPRRAPSRGGWPSRGSTGRASSRRRPPRSRGRSRPLWRLPASPEASSGGSSVSRSSSAREIDVRAGLGLRREGRSGLCRRVAVEVVVEQRFLVGPLGLVRSGGLGHAPRSRLAPARNEGSDQSRAASAFAHDRGLLGDVGASLRTSQTSRALLALGVCSIHTLSTRSGAVRGRAPWAFARFRIRKVLDADLFIASLRHLRLHGAGDQDFFKLKCKHEGRSVTLPAL